MTAQAKMLAIYKQDLKKAQKAQDQMLRVGMNTLADVYSKQVQQIQRQIKALQG